MDNTQETKFFIMLPVDNWGNTRYGDASQIMIKAGETKRHPVIEAKVEQRQPWEGDKLTVVAPDESVFPWPTIIGRIGNEFGVSFMEVDGPARVITESEWVSIIRAKGDEKLVQIVSQFEQPNG